VFTYTIFSKSRWCSHRKVDLSASGENGNPTWKTGLPLLEDSAGSARNAMVARPGWWDTHSENVREMAKGKVSHPTSSALFFHRSASSLGDANNQRLRICNLQSLLVNLLP
jgi:hypothetical protein